MKKENKTTKVTPQKSEFALKVKRGPFDAVRDGIPNLPESSLRCMATYWLGSELAMILPKEELLSTLVDAIGNPEKFNQILDRLPKRGLDLLYYIISEGGSISMGELEAGFPRDSGERLEDILQPLAQRGVSWECRIASKPEPLIVINLLTTAANKFTLPNYLSGKYGTVLQGLSKEQQQNLVKLLEGDYKKIQRDKNFGEWVKTELLNLPRIRRLYESIPIDDRKVLKILALHPAGLTYHELIHELALFCDQDSEATLTESLRRLKDELGLIYLRINESIIGRRQQKLNFYMLPREMGFQIRTNFREKYRDHRPTVTVFKTNDEDFNLGARGKEHPTLWIDFHQLLNHLVRCEVGVIRKGGMHKKNLKRILDRLEGRPVDSYHYLDFLFLYAYQKDIFYADGERWRINIQHIVPLQNADIFYRDFWAFYRQNGSWNDRDASPLQGVLQKGDMQVIFALRRAILRQIYDCPVGEWIEMKVFFRELCDRELAFRSGPPPGLTNDPIKEKYRFMKASLERSLNWIGIVDTTTISTHRLDLFKVTESGAWLLRNQNEASPFFQYEGSDKLSIQPNLEVIVRGNFPLEKQLYLARFTDDQKGRVILNRASIRRGFEENLTIRHMLDFLQENLLNTVPPNGIHLLEEMQEKAGQIYVGGEPTRLEVHDQNLMEKILHQKQLQPYLGGRESEKKVLVRQGTDLVKLIEELRRAGYCPRQM
jgi:hypothetical protein